MRAEAALVEDVRIRVGVVRVAVVVPVVGIDAAVDALDLV